MHLKMTVSTSSFNGAIFNSLRYSGEELLALEGICFTSVGRYLFYWTRIYFSPPPTLVNPRNGPPGPCGRDLIDECMFRGFDHLRTIPLSHCLDVDSWVN